MPAGSEFHTEGAAKPSYKDMIMTYVVSQYKLTIKVRCPKTCDNRKINQTVSYL